MDQSYVKQAEDFLRDYLRENLPAQRLYHNFAHAREVASVAKDLIDDNAPGREAVLLAALFHDSGYATGHASIVDGSVDVFDKFAQESSLPDSLREQVIGLIKSVHSGEAPSSMYEGVLHDANRSYMGRRRFFDRSDLLRFEKETFDGVKYSQHEWSEYLLDKLVTQKFYTAAGQDGLQVGWSRISRDNGISPTRLRPKRRGRRLEKILAAVSILCTVSL